MSSSWIIWVVPKSNDKCLYQKMRKHRQTSGNNNRRPHDSKQNLVWIACSQELDEKLWTDSPSDNTEGIKPIDTLLSDFCPPELWENKVLLF